MQFGTQEKDTEGELYSKYLSGYLSAAKNLWKGKLYENFKELLGKGFAWQMDWCRKDASELDEVHYGIFWEGSHQIEYISVLICFGLSIALQVFLMLLLKH